MQDFKDSELLKTRMLENIEIQPPLSEGATHRVIGKIPEPGSFITVNGLRFRVLNTDSLKGRIVMQIDKK